MNAISNLQVDETRASDLLPIMAIIVLAPPDTLPIYHRLLSCFGNLLLQKTQMILVAVKHACGNIYPCFLRHHHSCVRLPLSLLFYISRAKRDLKLALIISDSSPLVCVKK